MDRYNDIEEKDVPKFARSELDLGNLIGQGGFSLVYEIRSITCDQVFDMSEKLSKRRRALAEEASSEDGFPRLAVKVLRDDLHDEEHTKGVLDLAVEARLLRKLIHPNIISMRGIANSDPYESKFFVLLEILNGTLDDKIDYWRTQANQSAKLWCGPVGYCCANKSLLHQLWIDRISISKSIASALAHLHKLSIVYRDLKPENIGFDANGTVKMFDFGLAKKIKGSDEAFDGLYRLTGNTGSLRYMAPEVAKNEFYNLKVDSYSFAMVFWQICSLQIPYAGYNVKMHADLVLSRGYRPKIEKSWPYSWCELMKQCWSSDINERLDFDNIYHICEIEFVKLTRMFSDKDPVDIKVKKKRKEIEGERLDLDTRKAFSDGEIDFSTQGINGSGETEDSGSDFNGNFHEIEIV